MAEKNSEKHINEITNGKRGRQVRRDNEFIGKLVSKAASGDQCAWSELYNETFRDAYFVAIKITNNEDNAIELVHDAFITAFDKVNQLEDKSKFQSWLNMIVANKCRDFLRKRKPVLFSDMETKDGDLPDWEDVRDDSRPEEVIDRQETVRLIAEIIESLPEDQKLCIMMYYWNEFSVSEIASSLEVSEGTVKSRLNYARIKIKAQVEELEKKGTKLYGLAPIPLLVWSLKSEASAMTIPASAALAPTVASASAAASATASGTAVATNTVAGTVTKTVMSGIIGKIVAGVAALSLVIGGAGVYNHIQNKEDSNMVDSAYAMYEKLLTKGFTDSGLKITYYAYLDMNSDTIPELIVSTADGTPESWSECEVYTYKDNDILMCGQADANYDYFYYVNDKYVLGKSRMGSKFVAVDEKITLTNSWNESIAKFQPAISRNDGELEYISNEEYSYYHIVSDYSERDGFIESSEKISLQENTFSKQDMNEFYSLLNGRYSGGGVKDPNSSIVIGQWHATISNATENSMNLAFVQSESDCFIEDMILYKQEDGSYYGTGETLSGKAHITINIKSAECISVSASGFVNQMGMEYLYKEE